MNILYLFEPIKDHEYELNISLIWLMLIMQNPVYKPANQYSGRFRISRRWGVDLLGGHGSPMWALFGKNVFKNERVGSRRGRATDTPPDPPMNYIFM